MSDDDWDESKICSKRLVSYSKYRMVNVDDDKSMQKNDDESVSNRGDKMETKDTIPATGQRNEQVLNASVEQWKCPACERKISSHRSECYYCHHSRPIPGVENKKLKVWVCDKCDSFVIGSKSQCYRCHAPKADGCKEVEYRPRPDWICSNCGINVFPSRNSCFSCATPRMA